MAERSSVWFHEVSAPDLVDYATNVCDVAILPLGAIEQHGPHTPCAVDAFNAIGMTELIAKKSGATGWCPLRPSDGTDENHTSDRAKPWRPTFSRSVRSCRWR